MKPYGNKSHNSGVQAYAIAKGYIDVIFADGTTYRYTNESVGTAAVNKMKQLAKAGKGLSTYISQHVKNKYAHKY